MNDEFVTFCSFLNHGHSCVAVDERIPKLADFDANLFHKDVDFTSATQRALAKGVEYFVVPGSTLKDSSQAIAAAETHDFVVAATAGVHPYNTESTPFNEDSVRTLRELISSQHCLAVGECGLDFSEGFPPSTFQMVWFRTQVSLAIEFNKPLYMHIRNAHQSFSEFLEEETVASLSPSSNGRLSDQPLVEHFKSGNQCCVVHCFTGSLEELQYYVNMGCYIGLTGHIFSLPVETVNLMLQLIPLCKLVIETDAPYMGFKGCRESEEKGKSRKYPNVPAALPKIAAFIAEILGLSYEEVCAQTTENTFSFFNNK